MHEDPTQLLFEQPVVIKTKSGKKKTKLNGQNLNFVLTPIEPLTENQRLTFDAYDEGKHLLLVGSAGTGKTLLSIFLAMREIFETKQYEKLLIVRSVVPSKEMGFLPGCIKEKTKQYEIPYQQLFSQLFNRDDAYEYLKTKRVVEFISTSFLRGTTIEDCIVLVDEIQNLEYNELYTIMTRIGKNAKIILCGDHIQSDLKEHFKGDDKRSDVLKFISVVKKMSQFGIIQFNHSDICRSKLVKEFIILSESMGI
jgi:predicted ribonuclease YlaK